MSNLSSISDFLLDRLRNHAVVPVVGAELEFYLSGAETHGDHVNLELLDAIFSDFGKRYLGGEKEYSPDQYEIALTHRTDLTGLVADCVEAKRRIGALDGDVRLDAAPFADRAGSGLHWHVHLEDFAGEYVFTRMGNDAYATPLLYCVGGLLAMLNESLPLYAPKPESMRRFAPTHDAPATVSWGPNNRTVAIRLPTAPLDRKRIEFRVPGSDADPAQCLIGILAGLLYGLDNNVDPAPPIYGNATDRQYTLPAIASWEEGRAAMAQSTRWPELLGAERWATLRQAVGL